MWCSLLHQYYGSLWSLPSILCYLWVGDVSEGGREEEENETEWGDEVASE